MRFIAGMFYLALIIWAVIDLLNSNRSGQQKLVWILVIVFFPVAGPVIYYLLSRKIIRI